MVLIEKEIAGVRRRSVPESQAYSVIPDHRLGVVGLGISVVQASQEWNGNGTRPSGATDAETCVIVNDDIKTICSVPSGRQGVCYSSWKDQTFTVPRSSR